MLLSLLLALAASVEPTTTPPVSAAAPTAATAAATTTATDPAAAKPAPAPAEKLVCHSEIVTGSRFPKRVCVRADEVAEKRLEDQTRVRSMQTISGGQYH